MCVNDYKLLLHLVKIRDPEADPRTLIEDITNNNQAGLLQEIDAQSFERENWVLIIK